MVSIGPDLFDFLRDLRVNNDRDWFKAHKARYEEDVKEPMLAFIAACQPFLKTISPHLRADPRPVGGSLFRIYRDTRFAKDKSPYKTNVGAHFRHKAAKDVHAPGYYLHLEPGQVFAGAGVWHPDGATTKTIREAIVERPEAWTKAVEGLPLVGESLKRPPRGFDAEHPLIEDLKRKDFITTEELDETVATAPDFLDRYASFCRRTAPLMAFLATALKLEW